MTYIPTNMVPSPLNISGWKGSLEINDVFAIGNMRTGKYAKLLEITEDGCLFDDLNGTTFILDWNDEQYIYKLKLG